MAALIADFVRRYVREQDFYARVAELCGRRLEQLLREANVRAITSWRAKRPDRLQKKLEEREASRTRNGGDAYSTDDEIYADVPDLAGARIALYFPKDRELVSQLITGAFLQLRQPKRFPVDPRELSERARALRQYKRFPGYAAEHFRVQLREDTIAPEERRYCEGRCEIQVASVLMHAWSEVEHDLEYKDLSGTVSETESVLLDQINGLVIAGEIALEQLQRATAHRTGEPGGAAVRDQYDLANFLRAVAERIGKSDLAIGRADLAFQFLKHLELTGPASLPHLQSVLTQAAQASPDRPLAELLVESLLDEDPERKTELHRAKTDIAAAESLTAPAATPDAPIDEIALGMFLKRWRTLESIAFLFQASGVGGRVVPHSALRDLERAAKLDPDSVRWLREIQRLRSRAVHETRAAPTAAELLAASERLDGFLSQLPGRLDPTVRERVTQVMQDGGLTQQVAPKADSGSLVVNASMAVILASRRVLLAPVTLHNRGSVADTVLAASLQVDDIAVHSALPIGGLEVSGMPYLSLATGLRLEAGDARRGALYFDIPASVDLAGGKSFELLIDSATYGVLRQRLRIEMLRTD